MILATARSWLFVLALWGSFAVMVTGVTLVAHPNGNPPVFVRQLEYTFGGEHSTPPCFTTLVQALRTERAHGVWDCFSPKERQAFFVTDGWQGDADFQHRYLDRFTLVGVRLEVKVYAGNPVCATDPASGQSVCNRWLVYVTPILSDGTRLEGNAFSLTATIDSSGEIADLA